METVVTAFEWLNNFRTTPEILTFAEVNLLKFVYVGLAFGFALLLLELRLPLKYYWDIPSFVVRRLLIGLGLKKKDPVWGRCIDKQTEETVPMAAVELLDYDSRERIKLTFTNRLGEYGFEVRPGKFIVRAVKNYYIMPPFFDPENIRLTASNESFALAVTVPETGLSKNQDLFLQSIFTSKLNSPIQQVMHYSRTFSFALGNGFVILAVIGSWYGWVILQTPLYGVLMVVGIVLAFIKIYILETVGRVGGEKKRA